MPRYASRERQQAEEARHRREIHEAAVRVFAIRGFQATTMRDVARAAAFSVGKLYLHFPSKEALYQELVDSYADELIELIERTLQGPGPTLQRIERLTRETLDYLFQRNPMLLRLFVNETLGFELRLQTQFGRSFAAKYDRMLGRIRRALEKGIESGELCGATGEELALKYSGIFNAVLTSESKRKTPRPSRELADVILRLFFDGARRSGKAPAKARSTT